MTICIHPFFFQLPDYEFGYCMSGPSFGFMVDASTCAMRMIYRGVFDRFPKLDRAGACRRSISFPEKTDRHGLPSGKRYFR